LSIASLSNEKRLRPRRERLRQILHFRRWVAANILLEQPLRKTSVGVHNFVLGRTLPIRYALRVACTATSPPLKKQVAEFWNAEPCGTRYLGPSFDFEAHSKARYQLEPHIPLFARFSSSRGLRILEIGVGMGADYAQWLKSGAKATGVDLSSASIDRARRRCKSEGLISDLKVADAEDLTFPDSTFDVVYSYGVMHHSPNTQKCIEEALRVLKPDGQARIMLYHHVSLTGLMLWLRYGIWHGQSVRRCVYERLESPGTKTFTINEVRSMMRNFEEVAIQQVFSPGDLLLNYPSSRFQRPIYQLIWKLFPRRTLRRIGRRWGLFLLITARKPAAAGPR
jgi:ubiquinone/menaquinone biosynthesis C-methylase UbiE